MPFLPRNCRRAVFVIQPTYLCLYCGGDGLDSSPGAPCLLSAWGGIHGGMENVPPSNQMLTSVVQLRSFRHVFVVFHLFPTFFWMIIGVVGEKQIELPHVLWWTCSVGEGGGGRWSGLKDHGDVCLDRETWYNLIAEYMELWKECWCPVSSERNKRAVMDGFQGPPNDPRIGQK